MKSSPFGLLLYCSALNIQIVEGNQVIQCDSLRSGVKIKIPSVNTDLCKKCIAEGVIANCYSLEDQINFILQRDKGING